MKRDNKNVLKAFISYRTIDKEVAEELKDILSYYKIEIFLAPDDIAASEEWQKKILEELKNSTFVICLLSKKYIKSFYCLQETGMALILDKPIIPLSLDNTISPGFISKYQSKQITEKTLSIKDIIPGLVNVDKKYCIKIIFQIISDSLSWKDADRDFTLIIPLLPELTKSQANKLLDIILNNGEIMGAGKCRKEYLPMFIKQCSNKLPKDKINELRKNIRPFRRRKSK